MCPFSDSRQIYKNQFDKKEKDGKKKGNLAKKSQLYTNFIPFFPFSYNKMTFILLKRESKYSESKLLPCFLIYQWYFGLSLKTWGIALKFLFLHHENILFPND